MPDIFFQNNRTVKIKAFNLFEIFLFADKNEAFTTNQLEAF